MRTDTTFTEADAAELLRQFTAAIQQRQKSGKWWTVTLVVATPGQSRKWSELERIQADDQHTAVAIALSRHVTGMPLADFDDFCIICERTSPSERPS